ncbi:DUF4351 domain-containing protein [Chamaesiphon polymorphus]|uniref:DUF4351 domain-containing protein n=1 Tax=Chamaesiphon polymorphus CCALA 037 TaxID=2107692 RepID=A0A2T1FYJ5_9CYAN|nr:DUF4351 domain-containing protein [Chamaesiphon polymorphus]PSB50052.1 hypothetical protein C7B77_23210 [Chamaesiphon polymorphus CCALA 037]
MTGRERQSNEPHDKFIKQFVPVVLKNLFESQTSVPVRLSEALAIDILCIAIKRDPQVAIDDSLGLLGRLVAVHPTIIIEHYSNYLDLEDVDSCVLRSAIYWELTKSQADSSRKTRVTKDSVLSPNPLHLDRPFTWIFAAKCSENSLKRWNAIPAPEFGAHVYRLAAPGLSMGIVNLEALAHNSDTLLLKLLGKSESAKLAFADILKLDPNLELRNDIIEVSIKYCVYLEQFQSELTAEDLSFMTYVKEVEEAYQEWVIKRQTEGKVALVNKMVRAKFGIDTLTPELSDRLSRLSDRQLDEFTSKIFEWQDLSEMVDWLNTPSA